jgi:hypothetical protein
MSENIPITFKVEPDALFLAMSEENMRLRAENERLRARVEVLETIRAAAQALIDYEDADTYDPAGKGWEHLEENLRAALKEATP